MTVPEVNRLVSEWNRQAKRVQGRGGGEAHAAPDDTRVTPEELVGAARGVFPHLIRPIDPMIRSLFGR